MAESRDSTQTDVRRDGASDAVAGAADEHGGRSELPEIDPDRYRIEGEIARGGMGRILRAVDLQLDREVAIKQQLTDSPALARLFEREARITARLQHPAIVNLYEAGRLPGGELVYTMKLVSGRPLKELIPEGAELSDRLGLLPRVLTVCEALAYAHRRGVIHRDLKPSNVLVGDLGETVVIDWGLATDLEAAGDDDGALEPAAGPGTTVRGKVAGTPAYMAPEQAAGGQADRRTDVYGLGAMLYHVLAGRQPYAGDTASEILTQLRAGAPPTLAQVQKGVPADLYAIVARAMARDPGQRYPSAVELADDLRRFLTGQLVAAHVYSRRELVLRWVARHRAPVAVAVLAVAILSVVSLLGVRRIIRERDVAAERADRLTIAKARLMVDRDPAEAITTLITLPEESATWGAARILAADAIERGIGRLVLQTSAGLDRIALSADAGRVAAAGADGIVHLRSLAGGPQRVVADHGGAVSALLFDPAGDWLASAADDGSVALLGPGADSAVIQRPHAAAVLALAFAPDGKQLASADAEGRVVVRAPGSADSIALPAQTSAVTAMAYAPDGRRLATASRDGQVLLWSLPDLHPREIAAGGVAVVQLAFAPDGGALAGATVAGGVELWSLPAGERRTLGRHRGAVTALTFVDGGRWLATAGDDGQLQLWRVDGGRSVVMAAGGPVNAVAFAAAPRTLIAGGRDRRLRLFDLDGQLVRELAGHRAPVQSLAVSGTGELLCSGADDGEVRCWRLLGNQRRLVGHEAGVGGVAFSRRGRVISAGWDSTVRIWHADGDGAEVLRGHTGPVRALAAATDADVAVTAGDDRTVRLWQLGSGAHRQLGSHPAATEKVAITSDAALVASAARDGGVRLWQVAGAGPRLLDSHRGAVNALAFSADDAWLASGADDGLVQLWPVAGGPVRRLPHPDAVTAVAFSPAGGRLATSCRDGAIRLWATDGGEPRVLGHHVAAARTVAFSRDGRWVASGGDDAVVRLWPVAGGDGRALTGHEDLVRAVRFAPSGAYLASTGEDGTVRLWDLASGESRVLDGGNWLGDLAISADGDWIVAAGGAATVRLWPDTLPVRASALRRALVGLAAESGLSR